jgi:hypothetical protein
LDACRRSREANQGQVRPQNMHGVARSVSGGPVRDVPLSDRRGHVTHAHQQGIRPSLVGGARCSPIGTTATKQSGMPHDLRSTKERLSQLNTTSILTRSFTTLCFVMTAAFYWVFNVVAHLFTRRNHSPGTSRGGEQYPREMHGTPAKATC